MLRPSSRFDRSAQHGNVFAIDYISIATAFAVHEREKGRRSDMAIIASD
jgi:hypothetical protein